MKNFLFAFFVLSSSVVFSQKKESPENELQQTINNYLQQTIKENEIPSLAVGVVKDEKILFEGYYGKENAEGNNPINENSIFRIYSTSKLISTVGVFQLIEKGKLSLDDKISKYLENLPKEWKNVKIKNLLSHSSGIPNIIRYKDIPVTATDNEKITRLSKEKMEFETGNQFSYNQTNYWLLRKSQEKHSKIIFLIINFRIQKTRYYFHQIHQKIFQIELSKISITQKQNATKKHLKTMDLEHIPEMASTLHYRLSLIGVSILITMFFLIWKLKNQCGNRLNLIIKKTFLVTDGILLK
ncbi:serine hydrolase domain-containing protein [Elizabethkingia meningoseptica]